MTTPTTPSAVTTPSESSKSTKKSAKKSKKSSSAKRSTTQYAFFMGYVMSIEDFKAFLTSLLTPQYIEDERGSLPLEDCIMKYDAWKRRLPRDVKEFAPILEVIYKSKKLMDSDLDLEETVSHLFFPLRYIPYKSEKQLSDSHPDSKIIREECEKDRRMLKRFVEYVQSSGGKLEYDMVKFGYEKILHPSLW